MCSEGLRERYVNPYTDFAFKLLFGTDLNKDGNNCIKSFVIKKKKDCPAG